MQFNFTRLIGKFDLKKNNDLEMYIFRGSNNKGAESASALNRVKSV